MNQSQRILLNTAVTYTRSIIAIALVLFSSRWVLNALGQTDFGIFTVVGSIIIFIVFLNSVIAASVGRHYAYAIGRGNNDEVNRWFNAALSLHLCMAVVFAIIGWPIGEYLIYHTLNIPLDRILEALFVFRVSLISAFFSMISVPYVAMFTAKQHIAEIAVWNLMQTILIFILAGTLIYVSSDRLIFYAVGMVFIIVFIQIGLIARAKVNFYECKINHSQWFDKKRFKEIFFFTGWNLIGSLGALLRDQGSAILLNLFYGPKVNAAYGIANQVSNQTNQLSAAMITAFMPEITTREGRGDREQMIDLSIRACKYGTLFILIFAAPLIVEIDYVLKLWLIEPPAHTAKFCQLILIAFMIDRLSSGYMLAVNAYGKIAAYQLTLGFILIFTLPLSWLFLKLGYSPTSVGTAIVITTASCSLGRILWVRYLFNIPVSKWTSVVLIPCFIVASASILCAIIPHLFYQSSLSRFLIVTILSITATMITAWVIVFDINERKFIIQTIRQASGKIHFRL